MDYYEEMDSKMSKEDKKAYGDSKAKERAESDVRTLMEAQEIKMDEKRHKMAMHCAKSKAKAMQNVTKGEE